MGFVDALEDGGPFGEGGFFGDDVVLGDSLLKKRRILIPTGVIDSGQGCDATSYQVRVALPPVRGRVLGKATTTGTHCFAILRFMALMIEFMPSRRWRLRIW